MFVFSQKRWNKAPSAAMDEKHNIIACYADRQEAAVNSVDLQRRHIVQKAIVVTQIGV